MACSALVGLLWSCASIPVQAAPGPHLASTSPILTASSTPATLTVAGSSFRKGMTATLKFGTATVPTVLGGLPTNSGSVNVFTLTATFATAGSWTLQVTNTDGKKSNILTLAVQGAQPPPLSISCPANQPGVSTDGSPETVNYPPATASGGVPPLTAISYAPASHVFAVGATVVTASVSDATPVTQSCVFTVTVTYTPPQTCQDPLATNYGGPLPCTYPTQTPTNWALASNGGTALASSTYPTQDYGAAGTINGERSGANWGSGGGWNDATQNVFPDWLEVDFSAIRSLTEIDVFSVQDNFQAPIPPTSAMTCASYCLRDFQVQYWDGSAWQGVPNGTVTGNTLVWQRITFPALTTAKIRVFITAAADQWSRLTEVEAWSTSPVIPPVSDGRIPADGPDAPETGTPPPGYMARIKAPAQQMHFTAGQPLRFFADTADPNEWQCQPGHPPYVCPGSFVEFFLKPSGGTKYSAGTVQPDPANQNMWELRLPNGLPAGDYDLTMTFTAYGGVVVPGNSPPIHIHIDPPPTHATTLSLTAPVAVTDLNWTDTTVNCNGFSVSSNGGNITISNVAMFGCGPFNGTTTGTISIDRLLHEASAPITLVCNGTCAESITNSEFRENDLVTYVSADPDASPLLELSGNSTGPKTLAGINWGGGIIRITNMSGWQIGGLTAAESNIGIGPRAVISLPGSHDITIQGTYDHHEYKGGWSQGFNLETMGASNLVAEHNVFREGSWPVQSFCGEFRYNLIVDQGGHDMWRSSCSGASVHHNLLLYIGGPSDFGGLFWHYQGEQISFFNNTVDVGAPQSAYYAPALYFTGGSGATSIRNNVFTGFNNIHADLGGATISAAPGTILAADYNQFFNPNQTSTPNYSAGAVLNGQQHDLTSNPQFTAPDSLAYHIDEGSVWLRQFGVFDVLKNHRGLYKPAVGSPLIDSADPADGPGVDRGAIGAGVADANDQFGTLTGDMASAPVGPIVHPSLRFTSVQLAALKAKAAAGDPAWVQIKAGADSLLTQTLGYGYQGNDWLSAINILGLAYSITGNAAYARKGLEVLTAVNVRTATGDLSLVTVDSGYATRSVITAMGVAFDEFYPVMDAATKAATIASGNRYFDWFKASAFANNGPADNNYFGGHVLGFGYFGLATRGDNPRATEMVADIRSRWNSVIVPAFRGGVFTGGYALEGPVYGANHFFRLLQYAYAVKMATGEDLVSTYAAPITQSLIYNLRPNRWQWMDEADAPGDYSGIMDPTLIGVLPMFAGAAPEAGYAQWLFQHLAPAPASSGPDVLSLFLWYDATRTAVDYRTVLPTCRYSIGDEHLYCRSDWTDAAVWSSIRALNAAPSGHQLRASGHVELQRGTDFLLVNAGQWKGTTGVMGTPSAYDNRSKVGNTLRYQNPWGPDYDGGQGWWGVNRTLDTKVTSTYSYLVVDASSPYINNINTGLVAFQRAWVFLSNGLLVVADHIVAGSTTALKMLSWHVNPAGTRTLTGNVLNAGPIGASRLFITTACCLTTPQLTVAADPASDTNPATLTYRLDVTEGSPSTTMDVITVFQAAVNSVTAPLPVTVVSSAVGRVVTVGGRVVTFSLTAGVVSVQ